MRFSDSFEVERLHLTVQCTVQVGRDGTCLVCSALSKARAAVEDVVDQSQASRKPYNGRLISQKVNNTPDLASRTSKSSAAPQGSDTSATDTVKSTRQPRGRAGAVPSSNANGSADRSNTIATSAKDSSAQQSAAALRQSSAVGGAEDTLLQERQRSSSAASTSAAPAEDEPASAHSLQPPSPRCLAHQHSRPFPSGLPIRGLLVCTTEDAFTWLGL